MAGDDDRIGGTRLVNDDQKIRRTNAADPETVRVSRDGSDQLTGSAAPDDMLVAVRRAAEIASDRIGRV